MNACSQPGVHLTALDQHYSPEQALAVWELLHELAELIWARYELPLLELIRNDTLDVGDQALQRDLFQPSGPFTHDLF